MARYIHSSKKQRLAKKSKETKWNSKLDNYKELSIKPDFICKKFIY